MSSLAVHLAAIQKILSEHPGEIYLVGGYLRDFKLDLPTRDMDFAVQKNPKDAAYKVARHFRSNLVTLEEEQEVFRVFSKDGCQFDFARFKGPTIAKDLAARDFSINAMAVKLPVEDPAKLSGKWLDPCKGLQDLKKKKVRQAGPKAFVDDPLRMLRAFRFAAQLKFKIDPATLKAIRACRKLISQSAAERVKEELLIMLEAPVSHPDLLRLDQSGLVSELFPEVDPNRKCAMQYYPGKGVWGHSTDGLLNLEWIFQHLEEEFGPNANLIREIVLSKGDETENHSRAALMKLAILLHDIGKAPTAEMVKGRMRFFNHDLVGAGITKRIARRLRLSANAVTALSKLVQWHMRPGALAHIPELTDRAKFRFFRDLGDLAIPMLLVSLADHYTYLSEKERGANTDLHEKSTKELLRWYYHKALEQHPKKPKLINGNAVMKALALKPGKLIGLILKDVDEAAALGEISTPEAALEFARGWLKRNPQSAQTSDNAPKLE